MNLLLRTGLLGVVLFLPLSGCIRNVSRHPMYQPLVGETVVLARDMQAVRQHSNILHWNLPNYALNGASGGAIVGEVPSGTDVRVQSFQRRTSLIGIPTDFVIVEFTLPETDEKVEADIRIAMPSVLDGGEPDFPWQNTKR